MAKKVAAVFGVGAVLGGVVTASAVARSSSQRASLDVVRVSSTTSGKALSRQHVNVVVANSNLAFVVKIRNDGARRAVKITCSVSRPKSSLGPIVKVKTVVLRANRFGTVKLGPFAQVMFAQRVRLKVSVAPARTREVWTTAYPIVFSLG